jgi:hypothetical protein
MPLAPLNEAAGAADAAGCNIATIHCFQGILSQLSPFLIQSLRGESGFNFQCLTASAANASGSLQTALTKLPRLAELRLILAQYAGQILRLSGLIAFRSDESKSQPHRRQRSFGTHPSTAVSARHDTL